MINIDKELQRLLLQNRERENHDEWGSFDAFRREMIFYDIVSSGDTKALERLYHHPTALKLKGSTLSTDPVVNQRYHSIITAALLSRFCIQAGLDVTVSYTISDIFIRMIDNCTSVDEIITLHRDMAEYYCRKMKYEKQKVGQQAHRCFHRIHKGAHPGESLHRIDRERPQIEPELSFQALQAGDECLHKPVYPRREDQDSDEDAPLSERVFPRYRELPGLLITEPFHPGLQEADRSHP